MQNEHTRVHSWRRWLFIAFPPLAAVIFALVLVMPASAAVISNTEFPINITVFVPCAAGGAGEDVALSGDIHDLFAITFDSNGGFHATMHDNPQGVSGIGLTTGDKYQGTGVTLSVFNGKVGFETTFVNNFRIIGQGPGNNFLVHENFHITVHPDGTVTGFVDNFSVSCK
jgi:hypothetical protein